MEKLKERQEEQLTEAKKQQEEVLYELHQLKKHQQHQNQSFNWKLSITVGVFVLAVHLLSL